MYTHTYTYTPPLPLNLDGQAGAHDVAEGLSRLYETGYRKVQ